MKKIHLNLLCGLLFTVNLNAQTWKIGNPNAADIVAVLENGTFTISGTGAMADFTCANLATPVPWRAFIPSIREVVISDGITSIGNYLFFNHPITSVTIGNNVEIIGEYAFSATALTSVIIPDNVIYIKEAAFALSPYLSSVIVGNGVTTIGDMAFFDNPRLASVTIGSGVISIGNFAFAAHISTLNSVIVLSNEPPTIAENAFVNVDKQACTLSVLPKSLDLFRSADVWKKFGYIRTINSID